MSRLYMTSSVTKYWLISLIIFIQSYIIILDSQSIHHITLPSNSDFQKFTAILILIFMILILSSFQFSELNFTPTLVIILGIGTMSLQLFQFDRFTVSFGLLILGLNLIILFTLPRRTFSQIGYLLVLSIQLLVSQFARLDLDLLVELLTIAFELIFIAMIFVIFRKNYNRTSAFMIILIVVSSFIVNTILLRNSVYNFVSKILISQSLGLDQRSLNFSFFTIHPSQLLALHLTEIFVVFIFLVSHRKSIPYVAIIITGLSLTYTPIIVLRGISINLYSLENEKKDYLPNF
ncbi:MAG: hypothetical protein IH840_07200 [Candidatus Heimdallarchaeota archaeon]|nr:hypothetical protein [Candidatus Heimdallarchaeota archaeon]